MHVCVALLSRCSCKPWALAPWGSHGAHSQLDRHPKQLWKPQVPSRSCPQPHFSGGMSSTPSPLQGHRWTGDSSIMRCSRPRWALPPQPRARPGGSLPSPPPPFWARSRTARRRLRATRRLPPAPCRTGEDTAASLPSPARPGQRSPRPRSRSRSDPTGTEPGLPTGLPLAQALRTRAAAAISATPRPPPWGGRGGGERRDFAPGEPEASRGWRPISGRD